MNSTDAPLRTNTVNHVRTFSNYSLTFALCALAMASWLVLRKEQPMKSRLYVPPFSTFLIFVVAVYGVTMDSLYVSRVTNISEWNIMRYYGYILYDIAYVSSIFAYAALVSRFIVFQNLSIIRKQHLNRTADYEVPRSEMVKQEMKRMEVRVKIYQTLLSQRLLVTAVAAVVLLVTPLSIVIAIGTHLGLWSPIVRTIHVGIWMLMGVMIVVVVALYDVIINRKYWHKPIENFVHRDKFRFRIDVAVSAFAVVIGLQGIILTALGTENDTPAKPQFYFIWIGDIARILGTYLALNGGTAFWFYMGSKLLYWLKLANTKNLPAPTLNYTAAHGNEEMLQTIEDEIGYSLLKKFVAGEFSTENIECWTAIQKIQRLLPKKTNSQRLQVIAGLYETYVKPGGILEVNITHATKEGLKRILQSEKEEEITLDTLKPLMTEVCMNLLDSFQRFKKTTEYLQFQLDSEFKKKSMTSMQIE